MLAAHESFETASVKEGGKSEKGRRKSKSRCEKRLLWHNSCMGKSSKEEALYPPQRGIGELTRCMPSLHLLRVLIFFARITRHLSYSYTLDCPCQEKMSLYGIRVRVALGRT